MVVKPDNGVGASDTHKLSSDEELKRFLLYKSTYHPDLSYIMEAVSYTHLVLVVNFFRIVIFNHILLFFFIENNLCQSIL